MKPLQISQNIVPLNHFKKEASRILRQLREEQRPIVVTRDGRPAAVLLPPEEFDRLQERDRFLTAVHAGLEDSEAGRLTDDDELAAELDASVKRLDQPQVEVPRQATKAQLGDHEDLRIAAERLQDPNDPVLDWDGVRDELVGSDQE